MRDARERCDSGVREGGTERRETSRVQLHRDDLVSLLPSPSPAFLLSVYHIPSAEPLSPSRAYFAALLLLFFQRGREEGVPRPSLYSLSSSVVLFFLLSPLNVFRLLFGSASCTASRPYYFRLFRSALPLPPPTAISAPLLSRAPSRFIRRYRHVRFRFLTPRHPLPFPTSKH